MADQDQKRAQQVTLNDRPSAADRVKQVQQLQQTMETQAPRSANKTQATTAPKATVAVFDVGDVRRAGGEKLGVKPVTTDPAIYAKAQVDTSRLFGGGDAVPELVGNPWKVISFATMLPVVFDAPKPLEQYTAKLPEKAVKTEQGLLFNVALEPKNKGEKTIQRAVVTNDKGDLRGAECRNANEVHRLLTKSGGLMEQLFASAFGDSASGAGARITNIASGRKAAFEVTLAKDNDIRTVPLNNFGMPIPKGMEPQDANIFVANYLSDRFDV